MFMKSVLALALLFSAPAFADNFTADSIRCEAKEKDEQIYIRLEKVSISGDRKTASAKSYSMSIVLKDTDWDIVPDVQVGTFEGKDLENEGYDGRKYKGHVKFDMTRKASRAGDFTPEAADLILSPEYTVSKKIPQKNISDPSWTWDIEVRKHSAVMAAHWDDHHGDYIKLDCYSVAHVNDSKRR
jgi:hypothetical protein